MIHAKLARNREQDCSRNCEQMLATASMMDLKFVYMGNENILMSYVFKDDGSEICVIWVTKIYTHDIFFKGRIKLYHTYLVFWRTYLVF
jgi:hypothetical protein